MVQLNVETAFAEIGLNKGNETLESLFIANGRLVDGEIHDAVSAHDVGGVHMCNGKEVRCCAVAIFPVGLSASEEQSSARGTAVRRRLSQRSVTCKMDVVSGQISIGDVIPVNVRTSLSKLPYALIEIVRGRIGKIIVVSEESLDQVTYQHLNGIVEFFPAGNYPELKQLLNNLLNNDKLEQQIENAQSAINQSEQQTQAILDKYLK